MKVVLAEACARKERPSLVLFTDFHFCNHYRLESTLRKHSLLELSNGGQYQHLHLSHCVTSSILTALFHPRALLGRALFIQPLKLPYRFVLHTQYRYVSSSIQAYYDRSLGSGPLQPRANLDTTITKTKTCREFRQH